ncbi:MAG: Alkaline phosphatase synthesis sensor protein PhoR [Anaerolineales bacterium]|nr:Alkaline phosphatase synthesis sensor protein PhoR [Anaerolineales bacterium]
MRRSGFTTAGKAVIEWAAGVGVAFVVIIYAFRIVDRVYGEMQTQQKRLEATLEDLARSEKRYRRSEEEMRRQRDRLEALLESTNEAILMLDPDGHCVVANQRITDFFDMPRDQTHGISARDLFSQLGHLVADQDALRQLVEELLSSPDVTRTYELEILQPNPRTLLWYNAPVRNHDGTTIGHIAVFRDVTAEREADKMKTEFVSMVSHELRTPLTSIKGFTDLMLIGDAGPVTDDQDEFLKIIKSNVDRLVGLIEDLLDVSRIEAGEITLQPSSVNVSTVIEEVANSIRPQLNRKNQSLSLDVPQKLPAAWGDADRVTQILVNLAANAHKYSPHDSTIAIAASSYNEEVHVSVTDNGPGIAPEDQEHLFNRFFRAGRSTGYRSGGTGLGLSIARSLVEAQGGQIDVDSEVGDRKSVSFTLPVAPEAIQPPRPSTARPAAHAGDKHILVVEDEPAIAELLRYQLEKDGYTVTIASTGEGALRAAHQSPPDLITMDILLPDIDGFETIRRLQDAATTRDIPIVVVSIVQDEEQALQLGVDAYLTKPIDEQRLLNTIAGLLNDHEEILVVDDDPDIVRLLRRTLHRHGFPTTTAQDGGEALVKIAAQKPALVLLDLKMPEIDGFQVLRTLKSKTDTRHIPVIVMTGIAAYKEHSDQVITLGATNFLTKPLDVNDLISEIHKRAG